MEPRKQALAALVEGGATLAEAGRACGISRERVRQILSRERPGGGHPGRSGGPSDGFERPQELAPVIQVMWQEGMRYHEIAEVFGMSCGLVHGLIRQRVPHLARESDADGERAEGRTAQQRLRDGLSRAASTLVRTAAITGDDRRRCEALLAEHLYLGPDWQAEAQSTTRSGDPVEGHAGCAPPCPKSMALELERFTSELRTSGLRESTVHSYLTGSSLFVRWLAGDYKPGPGRI